MKLMDAVETLKQATTQAVFTFEEKLAIMTLCEYVILLQDRIQDEDIDEHYTPERPNLRVVE
jgi:hypothetical protein